MLANVFQQTTIPVLEEVVCFAQARHEVLAGNIANIDTPGYKTADLSPEVFQSQLRSAIDKQHASPASADSGWQDPDRSSPLRQVRESMKTILRHDDANVGLEQQVMEITKNQTTHNMAIALMNGQFRLLESAVSERI